MDETLDHLTERLRPKALLGAATATTVIDVAKAYPVPTALVATGVATFLFDAFRGPKKHGPRVADVAWAPSRRRTAADADASGSVPSKSARQAAAVFLGGRQPTPSSSTSGAHTMHEYQQQTRSRFNIDDSPERTGGYAVGEETYGWHDDETVDVQSSYDSKRDRAANKARGVAGKSLQVIKDHPVAAAGAAIGIGLLAAALAPNTRYENRVMGKQARDLRHEARGRARQLEREAIERGEHAINAGTQSAIDEADRLSDQDSQRDSLKGKAREVASDARRVAEAGASAAMRDAKPEGGGDSDRDSDNLSGKNNNREHAKSGIGAGSGSGSGSGSRDGSIKLSGGSEGSTAGSGKNKTDNAGGIITP